VERSVRGGGERKREPWARRRYRCWCRTMGNVKVEGGKAPGMQGRYFEKGLGVALESIDEASEELRRTNDVRTS